MNSSSGRRASMTARSSPDAGRATGGVGLAFSQGRDAELGSLPEPAPVAALQGDAGAPGRYEGHGGQDEEPRAERPDQVLDRHIEVERDDVIGAGLLATPPRENAPARNLGLFGACLELAASHRMTSRIGMVAGGPALPGRNFVPGLPAERYQAAR
jgi:hypothetical protein